MGSDMVRAYVETLLEQIVGAEGKIAPDHDGDYPVRYRNALYHVRLVGEKDTVVQVFSIALAEVECTPELLAELNELNSRIRFARAFWVRGQVLVEADLVGQSIDEANFGNACKAVATITDGVAAGLSERHGGRTAFADEKDAPPDTSDAQDSATHSTGMYL